MCGVYGWMVHTRFFQPEIEASAEYDRMKRALTELLDQSARERTDTPSFTGGVAAFVARYT
jgi:hypothetical protein